MNADFAVRTATSQTTVERCLAELRRGGAIALIDGEHAVLAVAAETLEEAQLAWLGSIAGDGEIRVLLTAERAWRLGLVQDPATAAEICVCRLTANLSAEGLKNTVIRQLADPTSQLADGRDKPGSVNSGIANSGVVNYLPISGVALD